MSYVKDTFDYEKWEVDSGDVESKHLISIVNDFFKVNQESWYTELEPLEYWIIDSDCGATLYEGKDYNDCKSQNYEEIKTGDIMWQVQNLHVYERHFHLVE